MTKLWALYKKELRGYFNSPVAYIIIVAFLGLTGTLFFRTFFITAQASMRGLFDLTPLIFVLFGPAVSMRLIAEEKRSGSMEMLVTFPISDLQILVAKYLAALSVLFAALVATMAYPLSFYVYGLRGFDLGPIIGGYLGLLLLGGAYCAIGLMASTFTRNQVVAFIVALFISLFFFLIGLQGVLMFVPAALSGALEYLSTGYHFENIARGVIDSRDILYYLSLIAACLMISRSVLERRTWA